MCRENAFSLIAEIFVEACGARGGRGSGWGGHAGCCVTSHTAGAPRRAGGDSDPLVPPHWVFRGAQPGRCPAGRGAWHAVAHGTRCSAAGGGSAMRHSLAGRDVHRCLPARPGGFWEPGAAGVAQTGNGMDGGEGVPSPVGAGCCVGRVGFQGPHEPVGAEGCVGHCQQRGTHGVSCLCSVCHPLHP